MLPKRYGDDAQASEKGILELRMVILHRGGEDMVREAGGVFVLKSRGDQKLLVCESRSER